MSDTERPPDSEDLFTEARQKLALLINYAKAESTAEHTGFTGYEEDAWYHIEHELIDVDRAVKGIYDDIETKDLRIRELIAANAALAAAAERYATEKRALATNRKRTKRGVR